MRSIRRILGISWNDSRECKYSNIKVRKKFDKINNIYFIIAKRRLPFLGILIRIPLNNVPARLISVFYKKKKPPGKPKFYSKKFIYKRYQENST